MIPGTPTELERNTSADSGDGPHLVRVVTAADSGATKPWDGTSLAPGALDALMGTRDTDATHDRVFFPRKHGNLKMRLHAGTAHPGTSGETCVVTLIGQAHPSSEKLPGSDPAGPCKGKPRIIAKGTFTFAGSTCLDKCPVSNQTVGGTHFYEASSVVWTFREDHVKFSPDPAGSISGAGYQGITRFDADGDELIYAQIETLSVNITSVRVDLSRGS